MLKVLEMGRKDSNKYYKVLTNGNVKWVEHKDLYPEYAEALCEFYETHLVYDD